MNAPLPGYVTAQLFYDRRTPDFQSEAERDERIAKIAAQIEDHIREAIKTSPSEAEEIGLLAFSDISEHDAGVIARLRYLPGAEHHAQILLDVALEAAIKKTAEYRAIRQVEAGEDQQ